MHSLQFPSDAKVVVDVQYASTQEFLPLQESICAWVSATFRLITNASSPVFSVNQQRSDDLGVELTVRIVDEEEGITLNRKYRGQEKATNVLSFPCDISTVLNFNLLGDIVICAPVVKREADTKYKKPYNAHWAHMVTHGTLHLLGYEHESTMEARHMESIETAVLAHLGFPDPYQDPD